MGVCSKKKSINIIIPISNPLLIRPAYARLLLSPGGGAVHVMQWFTKYHKKVNKTTPVIADLPHTYPYKGASHFRGSVGGRNSPLTHDIYTKKEHINIIIPISNPLRIRPAYAGLLLSPRRGGAVHVIQRFG